MAIKRAVVAHPIIANIAGEETEEIIHPRQRADFAERLRHLAGAPAAAAQEPALRAQERPRRCYKHKQAILSRFIFVRGAGGGRLN